MASLLTSSCQPTWFKWCSCWRLFKGHSWILVFLKTSIETKWHIISWILIVLPVLVFAHNHVFLHFFKADPTSNLKKVVIFFFVK